MCEIDLSDIHAQDIGCTDSDTELAERLVLLHESCSRPTVSQPLKARGRASKLPSVDALHSAEAMCAAPRHRHFLFRGALPPRFLDELRILCAKDGVELRNALAHVCGEPYQRMPLAIAGGSTDSRGATRAAIVHTGDMSDGEAVRTFDWSLVDWSAEDPFAVACEALQEDVPAGIECERRTLRAAARLLRTKLAAISLPDGYNYEITDQPGASAPASDVLAPKHRRQHARFYMQGQREILSEALESILSLSAKLPSTSNPMESSEATAPPLHRTTRPEDLCDFDPAQQRRRLI